VKVVAAQLATGLDKAANLDAALHAVHAAAADGARLLVLPEATMCAFGEPGRDLTADAEPIDGPFVKTLSTAAAEFDVTVVAGMFEPADAGRVHNTVVAMGPQGLLGAYRKFHLYDALGWRESDRVVAGDPRREPPLLFDLGDLRFGVMNCYDLRFPEMARALADAGATVLLEPANWIAGPGKADTFVTLLRARAIENTSWVVAAAKPAPECAGCSAVVDPMGSVVAALGEADHGVVQWDLSGARVAEVREVLPVLDNRRFSVTTR
jgi:predicted amidohydrolase